MPNKPLTKEARKYIMSIVDYVISYSFDKDNQPIESDWFAIKKQILGNCIPKYRGHFSRRHDITKKFFINDFEREIIEYWGQKTNHPLHIDESKLHDDSTWVRKERGWALKERNFEIRRNRKPYENLYNRYKLQAIKNNVEFNLTEEEFHMLVLKDCCYCGCPPLLVKEYVDETFFHNEIMRIDRSKGYTLNNVVPACNICRTAQRNLTEEEFRDWLERAYKHSCCEN